MGTLRHHVADALAVVAFLWLGGQAALLGVVVQTSAVIAAVREGDNGGLAAASWSSRGVKPNGGCELLCSGDVHIESMSIKNEISLGERWPLTKYRTSNKGHAHTGTLHASMGYHFNTRDRKNDKRKQYSNTYVHTYISHYHVITLQ